MTAIMVVTVFEVSGDEIDGAIALNDACEAFVSSQVGFIYSKFTRSQSGKDKYNVVSVSEWESKAFFDAAFSRPELAELVAGHPTFTYHRGFYDIVRSV